MRSVPFPAERGARRLRSRDAQRRLLTPALTRAERISRFAKADAGTRTPDPFITSEVLYQLSYVGAAPDASGAGAKRETPSVLTRVERPGVNEVIDHRDAVMRCCWQPASRR